MVSYISLFFSADHICTFESFEDLCRIYVASGANVHEVKKDIEGAAGAGAIESLRLELDTLAVQASSNSNQCGHCKMKIFFIKLAAFRICIEQSKKSL
mmetsp:Transcript_72004/g.114187  ORF Transcript_72004/g.114187 Transcript_72004/m.114187 type:complete len:98 (+) Transcript_72004:210-503(+)